MEMRENLMMRGAMKLATDCAGVTSEDVAVIVCDYESFTVANQMTRACLALGACTNMVVIQPTKGHGAEPPALVGGALVKATVAFLVTTKSMSHTQAVKDAKAAGCRIITMPEFWPEMMISGAIEADFLQRQIVANKVKDLLTQASSARIVCEKTGTDISFDLKGRNGRAVDGVARTAGAFAAPPNIESSIAPMEGKTEGVLVVNASIAGVGLIREPVTVKVEKGVITSITGGTQAQELQTLLSSAGDPQCFLVGELGIGLNPCARLCGALLEDEAGLGTVHMAAGNNANFGGTVVAKKHIDMIVKDASLYIDDLLLIRDGCFLEEALG